MKATLEIDLQEAFVGYGEDGEEYSADFTNVIEQAIIKSIINQKSQYIQTTIETKINESIGNFIEKIINEKTEDMLNNFLEQPITLSDGYRKTVHSSLLEYVEQKMTAMYSSELNGTTCNGNKLVEKINKTVKDVMTNRITLELRKVEQIGRQIAKDTLDKNTTIAAIEQMLKEK